MARFSAPSLLLLTMPVLLGLSGCGWKFPEAGWMDRDPLAFITSGPKERVPDVTPEQQMAMDARAQDMQGGLQTSDGMGDPASLLGLNLDTYFAGDLNTEERVTRLEGVIRRLQNDLQTMQSQLDNDGALMVSGPVTVPVVVDAEGVAVPHVGEPIALTKIDKGPRPVAVPKTTVTGIRVGEHPGYVRLVFDVTGETPYKVDLDNAEHILVVELNGTNWQPPVMSESFGKMPLLRSYRVDQMGDGSGYIFVLQLKGATSVIQHKTLPALSGGGKRIMVDLRK